MPFDPSTLSAEAIKRYILLGRSFSSGDTLAQANQTLDALSKHAAALVPHGFGPADVVGLTDARDALEAGGVARTGEAGAVTCDRKAYAGAIRDGLTLRERGRSVVESAAAVLRDGGAPDEVRNLVATTLEQTARAPTGKRRGVLLDAQLQLLADTLEHAGVAPAAADRGGPEAVTELRAGSAKLVGATRKRPATRGTPEATERLDLLDGVVVTLARRARKAARSAARRLGTPALANAFALTSLKQRGSAEDVVEEPPKPEKAA